MHHTSGFISCRMVMMISVTIRMATADDAAAIVHLNTLFNGSSEPADKLAPRLADPHHVEKALLAEWDGQVVGFAGLRMAPALFYPTPQAELTELFVLEAYRRRGVGRALIAYAEALAQEQGAESLLILTDLNNVAAQALYHAAGYEDDAVALRKVLRGEC